MGASALRKAGEIVMQEMEVDRSSRKVFKVYHTASEICSARGWINGECVRVAWKSVSFCHMKSVWKENNVWAEFVTRICYYDLRRRWDFWQDLRESALDVAIVHIAVGCLVKQTYAWRLLNGDKHIQSSKFGEHPFCTIYSFLTYTQFRG